MLEKYYLAKVLFDKTISTQISCNSFALNHRVESIE